MPERELQAEEAHQKREPGGPQGHHQEVAVMQDLTENLKHRLLTGRLTESHLMADHRATGLHLEGHHPEGPPQAGLLTANHQKRDHHLEGHHQEGPPVTDHLMKDHLTTDHLTADHHLINLPE
ncbi:hypothetical protein SDC9_33661 [bioreactor metagenome]|uniref:Uncharacterized protein n=1 Tax=bioreactor metagenome TaxID=1076179 RepID=A0A644V8J4_9ZZZZ